MTKVFPLVLLVIVVSCFPLHQASPLPVEFVQEKIEMNIAGEELVLKGEYHFYNPTRQTWTAEMEYPFPVDATHPYPHAIEVQDLPFDRTPSGIRWRLTLGPSDRKMVSVTYRQKLGEPSARYILTTTRFWEQPLKLAEFIVTAPVGYKNVSISYPPDSSRTVGEVRDFYITRRNFIPSIDLTVRWKDTERGASLEPAR